MQIWDNPVGSGGLYNNQKKENPHDPLKSMDKPIGQWNTFHIKMIGEKVWVWFNGELVVDNVTLENYWERDKPIYPVEQIELQNHGGPLWFKNIYLREIPRQPTLEPTERETLPAATVPAGDLAKEFASPPDAARPWVYWFWLNGNINREGITADLEAMKRAGIGGVLIMEVDQGAPAGAGARSAARRGASCSSSSAPRRTGWAWK